MKTFAIIPALNEATTLAAVVDMTLPLVDHVVVIDDGSSRPLAASLAAHDQVTIIRHRLNLGKGAAMKTGVHYAVKQGAETVIFLDADGQHDPKEIPNLLAPIESRQSDIVFGVREFQKDMPLVARLGNAFLSATLRLLFTVQARDTQSGYRAFRLSIWPQLEWTSPRYSVETEMIVNVGKRGIKYSEVPIKTIYHDRYKGTTVLDGVKIFMNMITWRIL